MWDLTNVNNKLISIAWILPSSPTSFGTASKTLLAGFTYSQHAERTETFLFSSVTWLNCQVTRGDEHLESTINRWMKLMLFIPVEQLEKNCYSFQTFEVTRFGWLQAGQIYIFKKLITICTTAHSEVGTLNSSLNLTLQ